MSTTQTSVGAEASRLRVLRPVFDKLREWNQRVPGGTTDRPATILIGGHRVSVEPWERGQIARWRGTVPDDDESRRCRLVMEGLACMAKTAADANRLAASPKGPKRMKAELLLDSAIGLALQREVQSMIDCRVEHGALEEAKDWGSLLHRLRRTATWAMQQIEESEHQRIRQLADSLTELQVEETPSPEPPEAPPPSRSEPRLWRPRDEPEIVGLPEETAVDPDVERCHGGEVDPLLESLGISDDPEAARDVGPPVRTLMLGAAFAVSVILWATTVWLPSALSEDRPEVLLASLHGEGVFDALVTRFPSLYVDVDGAAWAELSHVQKWRHVEQASDLVSPLGFDGVLLRDEGGRPLAQWLRGRGIVLLDAVGTASARPASLPPE